LKIRHYLLLILVTAIIAFMQPLALLLGNLVLIFGVGALIYSDLRPETQDAWERKIVNWLKGLRFSLRKSPTTQTKTAPPPRRRRKPQRLPQQASITPSARLEHWLSADKAPRQQANSKRAYATFESDTQANSADTP